MDNEDRPCSVTLQRWEWDDILLSLTRYVQILEGDPDEDFADDVAWAEELGHTVTRLKDAIVVGHEQG